MRKYLRGFLVLGDATFSKMPLETVRLVPGSTALCLLLLFVLGTLVGSFLNVCIYRLPNGLSVVHPPSHCPRCNTRLALRDLIPLWSQLALGGKCRYCCAPISWRYFGIEFLTGVLFMLVGWWAGPIGINDWNRDLVGDPAKLLQGLVFMATLVVIFWVDYDTRLIPLEAAFLLGLAGVARDAWETTRGVATETTGLTMGGLWPGHQLLPAALPNSLWAMVAASTILWAIRALFSALYKREALGFGDVVLVGAIAANLGWNGTLWTFAFASTVLGAAIGLLLQVPRAMRARRWALLRSRKYLRRAQNAPEPAPEPQTIEEEELAAPTSLQSASTEAEPTTLGSQTVASPAKSARYWPRDWRKAAPLLLRHSLRKGVMPFGPMLAIGAVAALLFGASINRSYLRAINPEADAASIQGALDLGDAPEPPR